MKKIDRNFPQYIHDNARDEISHQNFLNAYLTSMGASAVNLEPFRTLPGSTATGSSGKMRLTNLMQLTLDTSWWTRYRSGTNNPDVNPTTFEQAVPDLHNGQFTAIPRTDADLRPEEHIQAIANTAAFHMPTVEQGGGSLRLALAQRVNCRLHDLRHTAATKMAENYVPEGTMKALLGHMSQKMIERYSHIRNSAKRRAVDGLTLAKPIIAIPKDSLKVKAKRRSASAGK